MLNKKNVLVIILLHVVQKVWVMSLFNPHYLTNHVNYNWCNIVQCIHTSSVYACQKTLSQSANKLLHCL